MCQKKNTTGTSCLLPVAVKHDRLHTECSDRPSLDRLKTVCTLKCLSSSANTAFHGDSSIFWCLIIKEVKVFTQFILVGKIVFAVPALPPCGKPEA